MGTNTVKEHKQTVKVDKSDYLKIKTSVQKIS